MVVMVLAPGYSIHTRRTIEALISGGHDVVGVCEVNPFPEGCEGYRYVSLPHPRVGSALVHRTLDWCLGHAAVERMLIAMAGFRLRQLWKRYAPGVVHLLWIDKRANACISGGLRPLVISPWGSDINRHYLSDADPYERKLCGEALREADMVICDAQETIERCSELAGKVFDSDLLHLGVDTDLFSPASLEVRARWREKLDIALDATVFISMRVWHPMYGHHLILEAFAGACKKVSGEAFLILKTYGKEGYHGIEGYEDKVRRRAEELGIADKVRWLDAIPYEQLPELYALSDCVLNYPEMDTLGVTLVEAAACKRPIISCNLPSYRETFVERYARLVPRDDLKKLEEAMIEVIDNTPIHDDSMLEGACKEVELEFSYKAWKSVV